MAVAIKWVLTLLVVAAVLYLGWAIWDFQALLAWMQRARPLPFFLAMAILPACGAPLTPFFLLAGATFGSPLALVGSGLALAANLTICYVIARGGIRPRLITLLRRFDYELPDFDAPERGALRFTVTTKMAPGIPGFVKNYGLGAAGVPFAIYFVTSMVITGAYAAALIVLGESLLEHELDRGAIAVAVIAALGLGLWWWLRRDRRATCSSGTRDRRRGAADPASAT